MQWKDTLLPGGSRTPVPVGTPGSVPDYYRTPVGRMDFVMGPGGVPVISGSSEQQGGPMVPSEGFLPVDPGVYGGQVFAGRSAPAQSSALSGYQGQSAELLALLKALGSLDLSKFGMSVDPATGGLKLPQ